MTAPYSVGTVATYECNEGYELTGPGVEMRTCVDNGDGHNASFNGIAPTCNCKLFTGNDYAQKMDSEIKCYGMGNFGVGNFRL